MIKVNLLPEEFRKVEKKSSSMPTFVGPKSLLIILGALVACQVVLHSITEYIYTPKYEKRQDEFFSLGPRLKIVRGVKTKTSKMQEVFRGLEKHMIRPFYWTAVMNSVAQGMIRGVWLYHIEIESKEMAKEKVEQDEEKKEGQPAGRRRRRKKGEDKEKRVVLSMRGRIATSSGETAVISRFISSLKDQVVLQDIFEEIFLEKISREAVGERQVYDFTVLCMVDRKYEKDFYLGREER